MTLLAARMARATGDGRGAVDGSPLAAVAAVAVAPDRVDTTASAAPAPPWAMHHHCRRGVVGIVIAAVVVIYVLWLGTRVVRAIEKVADRFQSRAP